MDANEHIITSCTDDLKTRRLYIFLFACIHSFSSELNEKKEIRDKVFCMNSYENVESLICICTRTI